MAALNKDCFDKGCVCANCSKPCSMCSKSTTEVPCNKGGAVLECSSKKKLSYKDYSSMYGWATSIVKEDKYEKVG